MRWDSSLEPYSHFGYLKKNYFHLRFNGVKIKSAIFSPHKTFNNQNNSQLHGSANNYKVSECSAISSLINE
jgi:hypothetical protein